MELIENYLQAVARHLPDESRDDIQAELRSSLYEQLEDQSTALGRDLTESEQADFLKKLGHPLKMAARYLPHQYLIGPGQYPFYTRALKTTAVIVAAFHGVVTFVEGLVTGDWWQALNLFSDIVSTFLFVAAIVTVVFAVMERTGSGAGRFERWDPLTLRKAPTGMAISRGDMITNLIVECFLLVWWNGALRFHDWIRWNDSVLTVTRVEGWDAVFWPVNILLVASIVFHGLMLIDGRWRYRFVVPELIFDLTSLAIAGYLLRIDPLVRVTLSIDGPRETIESVANYTVDVLLWSIVVIAGWELIQHIRIAFRLARGRSSHA